MIGRKERLYRGIYAFFLETVNVVAPPYTKNIVAFRIESPHLNWSTVLKRFFIIPDRYSHHKWHTYYGVPLFSDAEEREWRIPVLPTNRKFVDKFQSLYAISGYFRIYGHLNIIQLKRVYYQKLVYEWINRGGIFSWTEVRDILEEREKPKWKVIPLFQKKKYRKLIKRNRDAQCPCYTPEGNTIKQISRISSSRTA